MKARVEGGFGFRAPGYRCDIGTKWGRQDHVADEVLGPIVQAALEGMRREHFASRAGSAFASSNESVLKG